MSKPNSHHLGSCPEHQSGPAPGRSGQVRGFCKVDPASGFGRVCAQATRTDCSGPTAPGRAGSSGMAPG